MSDVFAADTAAIFQGPLAVDATYLPQVGLGYDIRCILQDPDQVLDYGSARFASATSVFLVPLAVVEDPVAGDSILIGDVTYVIQGQPLRNSRRLWWRIEARAE
ncbi:MAG: hypothetical protein KBF85_06505 [Tabrizicola sp.]|nr:hypothetical protein [Tabrizicola sp.]